MRKPTRVVLIVIGLLVLAAAAWAGYWHWSANALEQAIARWTETQREQGYQIAYRGPEIGGFPTGLAARFEAGQILAPHQGWRWSAPPLSGEAKLWTPLTIVLRAPGRHEIERVAGDRIIEGTLEAQSADGLVELRYDGMAERGMLDMATVTWRDSEIGQLAAERVTADFGPFEGRDAKADAQLPFVAELSEVTLPEEVKVPLGRRVKLLHLDGLLRGLPPPGPLRASLAAWRDAGGVLELERIELRWESLTLTADGTLSLDDEMRPLGAFSAEIRNLREVLGALVQAGLLEAGQALALELGSGLVSERDADGDLVVRLPITLQNGQVYLGPVGLFRLSPVL